MKTSTESLANYLGLSFVNTQSIDGHPNSTHLSVTGFYDYGDAESFAEEVNGEVVLLCKKPGGMFVNTGRATKGIDTYNLIDTTDVHVFTSPEEFEKAALADIKARIEEGTDLSVIAKLSETMSDTYNEFVEYDSDTNSTIVTVNRFTWGNEMFYERYVTAATSITGNEYRIAVVDKETDNDNI
jgi:hypothetical protein